MSKIKVLYLDDELLNLKAFKASFRRDFDVYITNSTQEARALIETEAIEIIFSDQRMPNETGIEFFQSILKKYPNVKRILLTGYLDQVVIDNALNNGTIFKCFSKPWNEELIRNTILNIANYCDEIKVN